MPKTKEIKYHPAIGRRKTARARVRLYPGKGKITINEKEGNQYFSLSLFQSVVTASLDSLSLRKKFDFTVLVKGGGMESQAEAVRLGISRALIKFNPELRAQLKTSGYLSRDPRVRERKKYGLKRARRAAQWKKR
jgi:small subunit ribosomal protein S9